MKYTRIPKRFQPRVLIGILIAVIILITGGIILARNHYYDSLKPVSNSQKTVTVTIPSGSSLQDVATLLEKAKVIRKAWSFRQYMLSRNLENAIQAGTYAIKPSQSVEEIAAIITEGKVASNLVTIKPAQRIDQIEQALVNSGFAPDAVAQALNPAEYAGHPALVDKPAEASLEGYLYPESFQKTASTTPQQIVRASLDEMQKRLTLTLEKPLLHKG